MKKYIAINILAVFIYSIGLSQNRQQIDSLKLELNKSKHDTSSVRNMVVLTYLYWLNQPDSALFFAQKAVGLARQIKYPKGESDALTHMGLVFTTIGNRPKALELFLKALQVAESGNVYGFVRAHALYNIGESYGHFGDNSKAINYMLQSKNMFDSIPLTDMSQLVEQSLAKIYLKMHRLDTALKYAQSSYNQMIKLNNKTVGGKATILNTLGLVYDKKGDLDSALNYFYQSLNYSSKDYSYGDIGSTNYQIAKVYQKLNIPDSVVYYANQSLEAAIKGNFYKNMIETSSFLADFYNTRDFKIAYKYSKIAITAKDDLFKLSEKYAYKSVTDFDEKERQYEIETEQIAYKNKIKQYALLSGLGVFFLIAFILYRSNQKEKKAKNLLQQQKDKVESTLTELRRTQNQLIQKEKLASLGELTAGIAHEIQNPLNFVNNFSELSVELIEELKVERSKVKEERDEELENDLLSDLGQNQEKINHHGKRASSIVKGMLEHSRMGTGERQLTDLNVLCDEYLRLAYHGLRAKDKDGSATRFNCDYELITDPNLPQISVVPQDIGRVLLNLLNNAFYAVQQKMLTGLENRDNQTLSALEDYQPKVTVTTQALENQIIIKIKDNGMGIPENILPKIFQPFFTTKPTGEGTGLGLSLAYDIVTKGHGGTMEVESTEGQGSKFTIRLPLKTN